MSKILIIEDEAAIAELERDYLEISGFDVDISLDGDEGLYKALKGNYDLLVVDIMLPGADGFEICKRVREEKDIPVIVVSARKDDIDKIRALGLGADDYMTKPFSPSELVARVKSQIRRYTKLGNMNPETDSHIYTCGDLTINDDTKEGIANGEVAKLTPIEYNILLLLVKNPGKVFSIDDIYEQIWNEEAIGADNTVAVHIRHIRENCRRGYSGCRR